jgi:hypothetical protein
MPPDENYQPPDAKPSPNEHIPDHGEPTSGNLTGFRVGESKPLDMRSPEVQKGFPLSERMGKYCPGIAGFFKSNVAYFTKGDTSETMKKDNASITEKISGIESLYRNKSIYLKIYDTNGLELDPNIIHPFVRMHVLDISTHTYVKKSG